MSRGLSPTLFPYRRYTQMAENNAVCSICGKAYHLCLSCSDAMKLHPWKTYTDTQECFKVFQVVRGFSTGVYTKDEAREKLQNVDLKDINSFRPHIKKIVKDILKEEKVAVETTVEAAEKIKSTVVEDVAKIAEVKVEETKIADDVVKPTVSRKRNYKVEAE